MLKLYGVLAYLSAKGLKKMKNKIYSRIKNVKDENMSMIYTTFASLSVQIDQIALNLK